MTGERRRLALLLGIMAGVALVVAVISIGQLYLVTDAVRRQSLVDLVDVRASAIEAAFQQNGSAEATLDLVRQAHSELPGWGDTGEFVVAKRDGELILFLLHLRHSGGPPGAPFRPLPGRAAPIVASLNGGHGTLVGRDYRNVPVLAAYRTLDDLGWGLVAKMDMAEVRAPFLRAGANGVVASLWEPDPDAAGAFVSKFVESWGGADRTSKAAALRLAREHVRAQPRWRHPRYWAGWVLFGLLD